MPLHLDRQVGERILLQDADGRGCWLTVRDIFEDARGRVKVSITIDGDKSVFKATREELLTRDNLPPDQYREI